MISEIFEKGETRQFPFRLYNNIDNETLVIQSAAWKLTTNDIDEEKRTEICSGVCTVNGDMLITSLVPLNVSGDFMLEVTAEIPPETIKERLRIRVVE